MNADPVIETLRSRFGVEGFRGGQEAVVRRVLDGGSALAVFPTGAGKSLCYQLPALLLDGLTLVVSPLIALMTDQVEKLRSLGIGAARIDSTLADDEVEAVFGGVDDGSVRLLYVSPERLASSAFRKRLRAVPLALLAVDEAHCVSEWGHNFRPDYLKLAALARRMRVPRILALTATATSAVARDIRREFRIPREGAFHMPIARPNLRLSVSACDVGDKDARLIELLRETEGPVIVYATTRHDTERITAMLQRLGFSARVYHAGCDPAERMAAQEAFMRNTTRIIVATIAFGMGVDKPDIRAVIHYQLPKCVEGYCQETGRAGRDGLPSRCELLASPEDTLALGNFIHGATPSPQGLRNLLDRLLRLAAPGKSFAVSPYELSLANDMREETVETVLAYLELAGVIERAGSYHDLLRVAPVRSLEHILTGRRGRERKLLAGLFGMASGYRGELRFPLTEMAAETGVSRQKIADLVEELAVAGEIRIVNRGLRVIYQTNPRWNGAVGPVAEEIARKFGNRARFEHGRIDSMADFVRTRRCRAVHLAEYFGIGNTGRCGACDRCRGEPPVKFPNISGSVPDPDGWARMRALRDERHPSLGTPRQLARFLCGIPSPAATKAGLNARPEFGMWRDIPFANVLEYIGA